MTELPKIKRIYVNGKRRFRWKYDRKTGVLEFNKPVPAGAKVEIEYVRKRGKSDDGERTQQTVLPEQTDRT